MTFLHCVVEKMSKYCIVSCCAVCLNMKTGCVEQSNFYVFGLLGWVIKTYQCYGSCHP